MTTPRVTILITVVCLALFAVACGDSARNDVQSVGVTGDDPADLAAAADTTSGTDAHYQDRRAADATTTTTTTATTTTTEPAPPSSSAAPTAPPTTAPAPTAPPTTSPPPPTTAPPTTAPPPAAGVSSNCESMMTNSINSSRANNGLPALTNDGGIRYIGRNWSAHMAETDTLAHNPSVSGQVGAVRSWLAVGENVGTFTNLNSLYQAFMDSPGHRSNILASKYTHVSVGCVRTSSGVYWVTHVFWGA